MFGRRKQEPAPTPVDKAGGKGRATPTRKAAQAASRERARSGVKPGATRKEQREARVVANQKMRQAMKSGEERYLPARDKGPAKRFIRDYVDTRYSFLEFLTVVLVIIIVMSLSGVRSVQQFAGGLQSATILLAVLDVFILFLRLGRELKRRFPGEEPRGWRFYALSRAIQIRPLRMPKPQLKARDPLPEKY